MEEYERQKKFIPTENLVEICYEDLKDNPLDTVENIYSHLNLQGFDDSRISFVRLIEQEKDYEPYDYQQEVEI